MNQFLKDKRRLSGLRAKRAGESWENLLESSAWRAGCKVIRIPSGCRWVSGVKAVPVKTPFDFVLIKAGKSIYCDAKTTLEKNWSYSSNDPQQIASLSECAKGGCRAGYIVNFRSLKKIIFFSVEKLSGLRPRESLSPEQGINLSDDKSEMNLGALFYERSQEVPATS